MTLIRGRYEPLEVAGRGGQGEVIRAVDHQHDRLVAIKVRTVPSEPDREGLLEEARVLLELPPHPGLPLVREDFFENDRYHLVMDWIEGPSLAQILQDQGDPGLPASTVMADLAAVAESLEHLHAQRPPVVHGDVKPANVIRGSDGRIVLVDFGIARAAGRGEGSRSGTPGYQAPESVAGEPPTPASDVYSLAATAVALLTGAPPHGVTPAWEGISPRVAGVIERALRSSLTIDPARRPTARELIERLRSWVDASLPTGTVTLVLADVENAPPLWERDREAMMKAVARFDSLFAGLAETREGRAVPVRGAGDARAAVFTSPTAAAECVADLLRATSKERWATGEPLRARAAVHTGEADAREGEYLGPVVTRLSGLLAATYGGQVLLSQTAADLVADALPAGLGLRDLGEHRLRDLARPERVHQLVIEDIPSDFPPPASLDAIPNNLPVQLTSFVGREAELAEIGSLVPAARLITLSGAGGAGKTRIALQVAASQMHSYPDGVWLVELGRITDASIVPQQAATAVGVRELPGQPVDSTLVAALASREMLLVLDNCEHLIAAVAELVDKILRGCPRVRVIATSRERLGVAGEVTYRVPSLSLPAETTSLEELSRSDAVRLFVERARLSSPSLQLTEDNAEAIAAICHRLDGIPLAIELAAARTRAMSAQQVLERLDDRFRLLAGGGRTSLPRQQTLRATVDWSYELLSPEERQAFRRLGAFAGGASLEAVERVCAGEGIEQWEVVDLLLQLVDKSLLVAEERRAETRYRMLETVREYARDRLDESGEGALIAARHAAFFLDFAESAQPELVGRDQAEWLGRFEQEHDNLRTALQFCFEDPSAGESGMRLTAALAMFWEVRGYLSEGRSWIRRALGACPTDAPAMRASALDAGAGLALMQGDYEGAIDHWRRSLEVVRSLDDRAEIAETLKNLGNAIWALGRFDEAKDLYEQSLDAFRDLGDRRGEALVLNNLGLVAAGQNDFKAARALYDESVAIKQGLGDARTLAVTLNNIGALARAEGNSADALSKFREALTLRREIGDKDGIADSLEAIGGVLVERGDAERGARLLGFADALRREIASPLPPPLQAALDRDLAAARAALGEGFEAAWEAGRALPLEQATADALKA